MQLASLSALTLSFALVMGCTLTETTHDVEPCPVDWTSSSSTSTGEAIIPPDVSGSRLTVEVVTVEASDGSRVPVATIHDDELDVDCSRTTATDNVLRCLPSRVYQWGAFSDSACTVEAVALVPCDDDGPTTASLQAILRGLGLGTDTVVVLECDRYIERGWFRVRVDLVPASVDVNDLLLTSVRGAVFWRYPSVSGVMLEVAGVAPRAATTRFRGGYAREDFVQGVWEDVLARVRRARQGLVRTELASVNVEVPSAPAEWLDIISSDSLGL